MLPRLLLVQPPWSRPLRAHRSSRGVHGLLLCRGAVSLLRCSSIHVTRHASAAPSDPAIIKGVAINRAAKGSQEATQSLEPPRARKFRFPIIGCSMLQVRLAGLILRVTFRNHGCTLA